MRLKLLVTAAVLSSFFCAYSQEENPSKKDKYLSVQANQLIRQVLNFGGSSTAVNNPYLINFGMNNPVNGRGFNVGIWYEFSRIKDEFEDGDERRTDFNNFSLRIGTDKKKPVGNRWVIGWGVDVLYRLERNETYSLDLFEGVDEAELWSRFTTINSTSSFGVGPRLNFLFKINDRFLLSTEANYYLTRSKLKSYLDSEIRRQEFDVDGWRFVLDTDESTDESSETSFNLEIPVVINLAYRF